MFAITKDFNECVGGKLAICYYNNLKLFRELGLELKDHSNTTYL